MKTCNSKCFDLPTECVRVYNCIGLKCYILWVVQLKTEPGFRASLMALHFCVLICIINLPHVRVGGGNYLLQLSDMHDFEGNGTVGHCIVNFL